MDPNQQIFNRTSWLETPGSNRGLNASSAERSLLLGVITSHLGTLDTRDNDSRTVHKKALAWDQVTKQFNSMCSVTRSRHQIQTLFKNMKAKARKYQMRLIESIRDNVPAPENDPISKLLLQLLAGEHEQRMLQLEQTAIYAAEELSSSTNATPPASSSHGCQRNLFINESDNCNGSSDSLHSNGKMMAECYLDNDKSYDDIIKQEDHKETDNQEQTLGLTGRVLDVEQLESLASDAKGPENLEESISHCIKRPRLSSVSPSRLLEQTLASKLKDKRNFKGQKGCHLIHGGSSTFEEDHCYCHSYHEKLLAMAKEKHAFEMRKMAQELDNKMAKHKQKMSVLLLKEMLMRKSFDAKTNLYLQPNLIYSPSPSETEPGYQEPNCNRTEREKTNIIINDSHNMTNCEDDKRNNKMTIDAETSFQNLV